MLHVITLYSVARETADAFVSTVERGGQWHALAHSLMRDLIATDLLEAQVPSAPPFVSSASVLFICIDVWTSPDAYHQARLQPVCQALLIDRRRMTSHAFELGAFAFPAARGAEIVAEPAASN